MYLALILFSYSLQDPSWSSYQHPDKINNWGGLIGAYISDLILFMFGASIKILPLLIFVKALRIGNPALSLISLVGMIVIASVYESIFLNMNISLPHHLGGVVGSTLAGKLIEFLEMQNALKENLQILLLLSYVYLLSQYLGFSWLKLVELIGYFIEYPFVRLGIFLDKFLDRLK